MDDLNVGVVKTGRVTHQPEYQDRVQSHHRHQSNGFAVHQLRELLRFSVERQHMAHQSWNFMGFSELVINILVVVVNPLLAGLLKLVVELLTGKCDLDLIVALVSRNF